MISGERSGSSPQLVKAEERSWPWKIIHRGSRIRNAGTSTRIKQLYWTTGASSIKTHPHSTRHCWRVWTTLLQRSTKHPIKSLATKQKGRISPGLRGSVGCVRVCVVREMSRWMWNQKRMSGLQVSRDRPEQARDSSRALWIERCEELLSASCRISSYWHTGEPLKLCWMSQRVTGLLYFEDRSSGISLPLTLWAEMGRARGGNLSSAGLQVVQRSGPGRSTPNQARKQDRFWAESELIFTLPNPGMWFWKRLPYPLPPQGTSLLWGCFRWSRWAWEITTLLPLQ